MSRIKRICRVSIYIIKMIVAKIISLFIMIFDKKMRNIWIISERGNDARDNGCCLFEYIVRNYPNQRIYYVIDSNSPDLERVKAIGPWIEYNTFKHFIVFALSKVRISTHAWGGDVPYADYYKKLNLQKLSKKKSVFLQHGITKDYLPNLTYPSFKTDLFICGAKPEYDYVVNCYGHPKGVVQYTGLARYDRLEDYNTQNYILVMPTFRKWLQNKDTSHIVESEYCTRWNNFLNNKELIDYLKKYKIQLLFYPHHEMQTNIGCFKSDSDNVIIAGKKDYNVQELLKGCKFLITDFSSVFFDVSYMRKPIIYYQFDRDKYIKNHYDFTEGYFDYERDGFGKVVFKEEDLLREISLICASNYQVDTNYIERAKRFFLYRDRKNCQRIYEKILDLNNHEGKKVSQ